MSNLKYKERKKLRPRTRLIVAALINHIYNLYTDIIFAVFMSNSFAHRICYSYCWHLKKDLNIAYKHRYLHDLSFSFDPV